MKMPRCDTAILPPQQRFEIVKQQNLITTRKNAILSVSQRGIS